MQLDARLPRKIIGYETKPSLNLWNCSVVQLPEPVREKINHKRKMRLAWLASGNAGLLEYIEPFMLNKRQFEGFRKVILAIK